MAFPLTIKTLICPSEVVGFMTGVTTFCQWCRILEKFWVLFPPPTAKHPTEPCHPMTSRSNIAFTMKPPLWWNAMFYSRFLKIISDNSVESLIQEGPQMSHTKKFIVPPPHVTYLSKLILIVLLQVSQYLQIFHYKWPITNVSLQIPHYKYPFTNFPLQMFDYKCPNAKYF